jgi:hypothetical protein
MRSVEAPEVRYAWNGNVALAYQVFGEGLVGLVYLQGYCSHLDLNWESPFLAPIPQRACEQGARSLRQTGGDGAFPIGFHRMRCLRWRRLRTTY